MTMVYYSEEQLKQIFTNRIRNVDNNSPSINRLARYALLCYSRMDLFLQVLMNQFHLASANSIKQIVYFDVLANLIFKASVKKPELEDLILATFTEVIFSIATQKSKQSVERIKIVVTEMTARGVVSPDWTASITSKIDEISAKADLDIIEACDTYLDYTQRLVNIKMKKQALLLRPQNQGEMTQLCIQEKEIRQNLIAFHASRTVIEQEHLSKIPDRQKMILESIGKETDSKKEILAISDDDLSSSDEDSSDSI